MASFCRPRIARKPPNSVNWFVLEKHDGWIDPKCKKTRIHLEDNPDCHAIPISTHLMSIDSCHTCCDKDYLATNVPVFPIKLFFCLIAALYDFVVRFACVDCSRLLDTASIYSLRTMSMHMTAARMSCRTTLSARTPSDICNT